MRSTQTLFDYANSLVSYFKTTKTETASPPEESKKPSRSRSAFSKNKTPSLALPGRLIKIKKLKVPKKSAKSQSKKKQEEKVSTKMTASETKEIKIEKKVDETQPTSAMFNYLLTFLPAFAQPTPLPLKEEKKEDECKKTCMPQMPVADDIEQLETLVKDLESTKSLKVTLKKLKEKSKEAKNSSELKNLDSEIEKLDLEIDALNIKKVELVAEHIQEHARRRVDLFFYLLLAVRGKHVYIRKDSTLKQHGSGSSQYGTHACHSSLFPNLKFETLKSDSIMSWLMPATNLSFAGTQFEEVLNMTVELPKIVNNFDGHLEVVPLGNFRFKASVYVKNCQALLNKVSINELDIQAAMHEFFKIMHEFFSTYKPESQAEQKIWEYEYAGTFLAANKDLTLKDEYLYMMLRLDSRRPAEIKKEPTPTPSAYSLLNFYSHEMSEVEKVKKNPKLLPEYYQRMQNEILSPATSGIVPEKKRTRTARS